MGDDARTVTVEREIAADADVLYALVADVERMGEWSPETETCAWINGATGPTVGAQFRGNNRLGKRRWSTTCTVSTADPGTAFAFDVTAGPVRIARWAYRFERDGSGCRVTETWTDRRGRFATFMGKPLSGVADRAGHNRASMEETLERLAAAAEQPTS